MKNILLIVDPQNDFITGTLPVAGAEEKMRKLAEYIKEKGHAYDRICITFDSHPSNHCSFADFGGIWPYHCITETDGWNLPDYLEEVLEQYYYYLKGTSHNKEEYSIFDNEKDGAKLRRDILDLVRSNDEVYIDVCGIAGDYCVLETLKGLRGIIGNDYISVLSEFVASIDGGEKLNAFLNENGINNIVDSSLNLEKYVY